MRIGCACLLLAIALAACGGSDPPAGADAAVAVPDAAAPFLPGWNGQFCAAGAQVVSAGGTIKGTYCFGPLDVASQPAAGGGLRWEPGPIYVVSP